MSWKFTAVALIFSTTIASFSAEAQVGQTAKNFTVTDVDGQSHTLYEYLDEGKFVLLDFFYTTCTPCQYYSPQVNLAFEKFGCNKGEIIFLALDYDDTDAEVKEYDDEYAIEFPSISGKNGGGNSVVLDYAIKGFPTFYLIDSSRKILEDITPPTLEVFKYRFQQYNIAETGCITGISKKPGLLNLSIFPNPTKYQATTISLPVTSEDYFNLIITNILGQVLQQQRIKASEGNISLILNNLPPGHYEVSLLSDKSTWKGHLVVQ